MWITHNRSQVEYSTIKYTLPTTYYEAPEKMAKCLISYYGITNETCWYPSKIESGEADFEDTLGQHLVEAHWKYFINSFNYFNYSIINLVIIIYYAAGQTEYFWVRKEQV